MTTQVTQIGNWDNVQKVVNSLNRTMKVAARTSLQEFAFMAESTAKAHISFQDLPWLPLSEQWLEFKIKNGLSEDIYVATSSYFQGITSFVDMKTFTAFAGVRRGVYNANGQELVNIAELLEYGFFEAGLPPRPLWEPTWEETMAWWNANARPDEIFARIMINKATGVYKGKSFGR